MPKLTAIVSSVLQTYGFLPCMIYATSDFKPRPPAPQLEFTLFLSHFSLRLAIYWKPPMP